MKGVLVAFEGIDGAVEGDKFVHGSREHAVGNSREGVAFNEVDAAHLERRRDGAEDVLRSVNHIAALEFYRIIWLTNFVAENRADVLPDRTRLVVWLARPADDAT